MSSLIKLPTPLAVRQIWGGAGSHAEKWPSHFHLPLLSESALSVLSWKCFGDSPDLLWVLGILCAGLFTFPKPFTTSSSQLTPQKARCSCCLPRGRPCGRHMYGQWGSLCPGFLCELKAGATLDKLHIFSGLSFLLCIMEILTPISEGSWRVQ